MENVGRWQVLACIVSFGGYIYGLSHRFAHSPTQAPKTSAGIDGKAIKHICMELPGHSREIWSLTALCSVISNNGKTLLGVNHTIE